MRCNCLRSGSWPGARRCSSARGTDPRRPRRGRARGPADRGHLLPAGRAADPGLPVGCPARAEPPLHAPGLSGTHHRADHDLRPAAVIQAHQPGGLRPTYADRKRFGNTARCSWCPHPANALPAPLPSGRHIYRACGSSTDCPAAMVRTAPTWSEPRICLSR